MGANKIGMYIGDSWDGEIIVVNESGVAVDLTNSTGIASFKRDLTDTSYSFQRKNTAGGGGADEIEMSNPTGGICKLHIVPANTSGLQWGQYSYDVWLKLSSGKQYTVIHDDLILIERVQ